MKYYLQKTIINSKTYFKYEIDVSTTREELYDYLINNSKDVQLIIKGKDTLKSKDIYGFYKINKNIKNLYDIKKDIIKVEKITSDISLQTYVGFLIQNIIEKKYIFIVRNHNHSDDYINEIDI